MGVQVIKKISSKIMNYLQEYNNNSLYTLLIIESLLEHK